MELSAAINTSIFNAIALLDSMSTGICALDHNYNYIAFNTAHRRVARRSTGIDINAGDYYPDTVSNDPAVKKNELKILSRVLNGENIHSITDSGEPGLYRARYHISYNPVRDAYGHIAGIIIFSQDISEITGSQKENAENTKLLNGMTSNLPVIIYRINKHGMFTLSIGAGLKKIGLMDNEVVGMNMIEMFPDLTAYINNALNGQIVQFETTSAGMERELWFQHIIFPDENSDGGIVGFALDITANKQAQQAFLKVKEEVEAAAESKNRFLFNMNHEILTPINGIFGLTNVMVQEYSREEKLRMLKFSGETLLALVNDN